YGAFNHAQVRALGFSNTMIHDRVDKKAWRRLAPGVYALASAAPSWRRQYKAAELSTAGAAIAGLAAAKLHGFDGFRTNAPELVVPYTSKTRNPLARVHRARDVPTLVVEGIRVTTVAQTLFDLVSRLSLDRLERTLDSQLLTGRVSIADLVERRQALDLARRP